jgi:phage protein U
MAANSLTLFQFGGIQFEVFPMNAHEMDHITGTDWSRKEIAGAAIYREWVGEGDEEIHLRGRVFPYFMATHGQESGINHLNVLDNIRRLGKAHTLVRGDGWSFGWYVIERLSRNHVSLSSKGIGKQINFEATFQRVPVPQAAGYYTDFMRSLIQDV